MKYESVILSSDSIEFSETDTYVQFTSRVCYFDAPNANGVMLSSKNALEKAQTLVDMPVVAKYTINANGEPTFKGHEAYVDEDGLISFGTKTIGTHVDVYIEEDDVKVGSTYVSLPCLFATYKIWKRNKNAVSAATRLYSLDKLYSSWEIATKEYSYKDNVKKITDYEYLGNCLLGFEYSTPAYGENAKAISMSEDIEDIMARAVAEDIYISKKGGDTVKEKAIKNKEIEKSELTSQDVYRLVQKAVNEKEGCRYAYIEYLFPVSQTVLVKDYDRESKALEYIKFNYTIENEEISVDKGENIELVVSPLEINDVIAEKDKEIEKLGDAVAKASKDISELKPFKEKYEQAEQDRIAQELAEQQEDLVEYAMDTGLFEQSEFDECETLTKAIQDLDISAIKSEIADRFIKTQERVEVSETGNSTVEKIKLPDKDIKVTPNDFVSAFLKRK